MGDSKKETRMILEELVDEVIEVITNDGRVLHGTLKGFDQTTNIILEECHERVYSTNAGVDRVVLGLYIVRGDNMYRAIIGEVDTQTDEQLDFDRIMAEPLKPVVH